jgi:hypothetical protein
MIRNKIAESLAQRGCLSEHQAYGPGSRDWNAASDRNLIASTMSSHQFEGGYCVP